jgi:O-antigen/teichoic acid export membrane protein
LQRLISVLKGPQGVLLASNIMCAVLGLAQGLYAARELGAAAFGVIGVLQAFAGLASNFWDVRLIDLTTKLHYTHRDSPADQSSNMALSLLLNTGLALLMGLSTTLLCLGVSAVFVETPVSPLWAVAQGAIAALGFVLGAVQVLIRLTNAFRLFALLRILAQGLILALMVSFLIMAPDLTSYFSALVVSSVVGLVVSVACLFVVWRRAIGFEGLSLKTSWPHYKGELRFILSANVLSYSKMLSRSGDILVFNYFAGDYAAGVYRLARSLTDNLSVFTMALSQYYFPWFLEQLHAQRHAVVARAIRLFVGATGAFMLVLVPGAYVFLTLVNLFVLKNAYADLPLTATIMVVGFFWTCGIHMWLWPVVMDAKQTHRFAFWATIGGVVQLALIAALCHTVSAQPALAAWGVVAYYLVAYTPLLLWWKGHRSQLELAH